jgi:hypothetical protein
MVTTPPNYCHTVTSLEGLAPYHTIFTLYATLEIHNPAKITNNIVKSVSLPNIPDNQLCPHTALRLPC